MCCCGSCCCSKNCWTTTTSCSKNCCLTIHWRMMSLTSCSQNWNLTHHRRYPCIASTLHDIAKYLARHIFARLTFLAEPKPREKCQTFWSDIEHLKTKKGLTLHIYGLTLHMQSTLPSMARNRRKTARKIWCGDFQNWLFHLGGVNNLNSYIFSPVLTF